MSVEVRLAVVGTVLIVVGLALWSLAAALIVAGLELLAASYVAAYAKVGADR
jgi:hypothetical protein